MCKHVCLHNVLQLTSTTSYTPYGFVDSERADGSIKTGDWRKIIEVGNTGMMNLPKPRGGRQTDDGKSLQNTLKDYLTSEQGAVELQSDNIRRTGPSLN